MYRVLHVRTLRGTGGGPDKTILRSCAYLAKEGHTAEAFYFLDGRSDTTAIPAAAKRQGVPLHVALEAGPLSWSAIRAFQTVLQTGKFDIVHAHDYKSNALARLFRRKFRYKIVATAHGYNRTTLREIFYYALERLVLFRGADAVIAPSRDLYQKLADIGVPEKKLHVIVNGIETQGWDRPPRAPRNGRIQLLYLGRFSAEKDPANLLRALALLKQRGRDVELVLAGAGPEGPTLEREAKDLDLEERVTMPGHVADVMPLLAEADILISPSRTECIPNTILEAMWSGIPVVATAVGGVGEMLRDGIDGLLCPPANAAALADAVDRLIRDPDLAQRLARSAYERVIREFTFEKHMEATINLYRHVLGSAFHK